MVKRRRLDAEMVRRELVLTRSKAKELVEAGQVLVNGSVAIKVSRLVAGHDPIVISANRPQFVSRGGNKLDAALCRFGLDVTGRAVVDVGASTGGFTDCVLQRGARSVVAIDVGYGQLDQRLRQDERVKVLERTNVRYLEAAEITEPGELVVADLSFISLKLVFGRLAALCEPEGDLLMLVKPQFEAGKAEADRGQGVIRNPEVWRRVLLEVSEVVLKAEFQIMGLMKSPLLGANGNTEFFLHCRPSNDPAQKALNLKELVAETLGEARS